jgi:hypothetical protein
MIGETHTSHLRSSYSGSTTVTKKAESSGDNKIIGVLRDLKKKDGSIKLKGKDPHQDYHHFKGTKIHASSSLKDVAFPRRDDIRKEEIFKTRSGSLGKNSSKKFADQIRDEPNKDSLKIPLEKTSKILIEKELIVKEPLFPPIPSRTGSNSSMMTSSDRGSSQSSPKSTNSEPPLKKKSSPGNILDDPAARLQHPHAPGEANRWSMTMGDHQLLFIYQVISSAPIKAGRINENYVLVFTSGKEDRELKWVDNSETIRGGSRKKALKYILKVVNSAIINGRFFIETKVPKQDEKAKKPGEPYQGTLLETFKYETINLVYKLLENPHESKVLYGNRSLKKNWIQILFLHRYKHIIDFVNNAQKIYDEFKETIDYIIQILSKHQMREIEEIKKKYLKPHETRKTLREVERQEILKIIKRLDLEDAQNKIGYDNFKPKLRDIIFNEPAKVIGCCNQSVSTPLIPFSTFFIFSRSQMKDYLKFITQFEEATNDLLPIQHFIETAKTKYQLKKEDPNNIQQRSCWHPYITKDNRGCTRKLFEGHAFLGILDKLTMDLEKDCVMWKDFFSMLQELQLKAIHFLANEYIIKNEEDFRKWETQILSQASRFPTGPIKEPIRIEQQSIRLSLKAIEELMKRLCLVQAYVEQINIIIKEVCGYD